MQIQELKKEPRIEKECQYSIFLVIIFHTHLTLLVVDPSLIGTYFSVCCLLIKDIN